jgi:hypothetical protein
MMCWIKPRRRGHKYYLKVWYWISYAVLHPHCTVMRHNHY